MATRTEHVCHPLLRRCCHRYCGVVEVDAAFFTDSDWDPLMELGNSDNGVPGVIGVLVRIVQCVDVVRRTGLPPQVVHHVLSTSDESSSGSSSSDTSSSSSSSSDGSESGSSSGPCFSDGSA